MSAPTAGPWVWMSNGTPIDVATFESPGYYDNPELMGAGCVVGCGGEYMPYSNPADARLIAAAPDLLAALTALLNRYTRLVNSGDCGDWDPETEPEVIATRAAIRKATEA